MYLYKRMICVLGIALLNACGGGGGGGGGGSGTIDPTLSGLAATGAALASATVTVKCTAGGLLTTTTTVNGSFSLQLGGAQSLPCMLKAESGATTLFSYATGYGRINITPLSDLVLAAAGNDTPANLFATFDSTVAGTISANLASAKTYVRNQVVSLDFTPIAIDPLTGTFVIGDTHDQILDQLQTALANNAKTLDDLRTQATTSLALNTALPTGKLVISEVASGFDNNSPFWFEIANVGNATVSLSGFTVKVGQATLNVSPYTVSGRQSFTLPAVSLAAGAFLAVSGQRATALTNTSQIVYISDAGTPSRVPYWTGSGSIELVKDNRTRSFVRFGANADVPTTGVVSSTAPALPNAANTYGNAIVLFGKTAAQMDITGLWSSVAWTTPAGPNDVPVGAVDADGDGIPDSSEISGSTFAGLDLYAMGVRGGQRDILIQVDYMNSADLGVTPQKQALDNVKAAFAAKNVNMVIDVGALFGEAINSGYNWGGGKPVTYVSCVSLGEWAGCGGDLYRYKSQSIDIRRASIFHYALFGNSQNLDGSSGSSGIAELPGNDFLVTLGNWGLNANTTANTNTLINYQAGTFMHELGHNLNLRHGGFENTHRKPNYFSVMNYLYQLNGLGGASAEIGPFQRWKCWYWGSCTGMVDAPADTNAMTIGYSNGSSNDLNENSLLESANIGRGASNISIYADWNDSGALEASSYAGDLNADGSRTVFKDFNDWSNILWAFNRTLSGAFGAKQTSADSSIPMLDPMSNDRQPYIVETLRAPRQ
jgi:hypothetical protein